MALQARKQFGRQADKQEEKGIRNRANTEERTSVPVLPNSSLQPFCSVSDGLPRSLRPWSVYSSLPPRPSSFPSNFPGLRNCSDVAVSFSEVPPDKGGKIGLLSQISLPLSLNFPLPRPSCPLLRDRPGKRVHGFTGRKEDEDEIVDEMVENRMRRDEIGR
ncbi:hypothetical protein E2C01_040077 [Portunus trituberculatus]|uniref:Uncharacterized protein n=1 Tax=Portunus trituberculatus TaxID=210409 RepID=A0A5B7FMC2_PORTR|nr:hypothetical protein [Portunus trituberculatus]